MSSREGLLHVFGKILTCAALGLFCAATAIGATASTAKYMVIDISGGTSADNYPMFYLEDVPSSGWTYEYKTGKIVLRRIPAGTFMMGSPEDEIGRRDNETQHEVTLTSDYWIGVFEMTQEQYECLMATNPASYVSAMRPVANVSYNEILGPSGPISNLVSKTGLAFTLPTEAQWEYACRAETTGAWNNGTTITNTTKDANLDLLGRYSHSESGGLGDNLYRQAMVGTYLPNAWGLYDMHGNVFEFCLDWYASWSSDAVTDPTGPASGSQCVSRGGAYNRVANVCRSASRSNGYRLEPDVSQGDHGFRLVCTTMDAEATGKDVSDLVTTEEDAKYMVVDVSGGTDATDYPVTYLSDSPSIGWTDEYKTEKIVLRRIPAGAFMMGIAEDEVSIGLEDATQHEVTLTSDYWIGVFEMTQKQYELLYGSNPSYYTGDLRPVTSVSHERILGPSGPISNLVSKTGLAFTLPTEAQWEYACRAGTTTSLNNGTDVEKFIGYYDENLAKLGRYVCDTNDCVGGYSVAHTTVGCYLPNAWGLYDMHGNVQEWCLDWYTDDLGSNAVMDPTGASSGVYRVNRGGSYYKEAYQCRSAYRASAASPTSKYKNIGFRLACTPRSSASFYQYKNFTMSTSYWIGDLSSNAKVTIKKVSGKLPSGVKLKYDKKTGLLTLSGSPKAAGTYTYTVRVKVKVGKLTMESANITFTFTVTDPTTFSASDTNYNPVAGRKTTFEIPLVETGDADEKAVALLTVSATTASKVTAKLSRIVDGKKSLVKTSFKGSWTSLDDGELSTSLTTKAGATLDLGVSREGYVTASVTGLGDGYETWKDGVAIAKIADGADCGILPTASDYAAYAGTRTATVTSRSTGESLGTLTFKLNAKSGKVTCKGNLNAGASKLSVSGSTYFYPDVTTVDGTSAGELFTLKAASKGTYFLDIAVPPLGSGFTVTDSPSYLRDSSGTETAIDYTFE